MSSNGRLRMAVQKSGRLTEKSTQLLERCGVSLDLGGDSLVSQSRTFPLDLLLVRDDDIPAYVSDGICELGLVGYNVVHELQAGAADVDGGDAALIVARKLGFGRCRLALAVPKDRPYKGAGDLNGMRIATSYPASLSRFMQERSVQVRPIELSGSVEIAPALGVADAVCDLVSSGATLRSNGLREVETLFESEAVLVRGADELAPALERDIGRLLARLDGVMKALSSKYVMMNAPAEATSKICALIPGMETPTVIPLSGPGNRVAIHAVAPETLFWETIEKLKAVGATAILVSPIEKIIS